MYEYIKHYTYFDNQCRLFRFDNKCRFFKDDNDCRLITNVAIPISKSKQKRAIIKHLANFRADSTGTVQFVEHSIRRTRINLATMV